MISDMMCLIFDRIVLGHIYYISNYFSSFLTVSHAFANKIIKGNLKIHRMQEIIELHLPYLRTRTFLALGG